MLADQAYGRLCFATARSMLRLDDAYAFVGLLAQYPGIAVVAEGSVACSDD